MIGSLDRAQVPLQPSELPCCLVSTDSTGSCKGELELIYRLMSLERGPEQL